MKTINKTWAGCVYTVIDLPLDEVLAILRENNLEDLVAKTGQLSVSYAQELTKENK